MYGAKRQRNICLIIIRSEKENDEPHSMEIKFRDGVFMMLRCDVFYLILLHESGLITKKSI